MLIILMLIIIIRIRIEGVSRRLVYFEEISEKKIKSQKVVKFPLKILNRSSSWLT